MKGNLILEVKTRIHQSKWNNDDIWLPYELSILCENLLLMTENLVDLFINAITVKMIMASYAFLVFMEKDDSVTGSNI